MNLIPQDRLQSAWDIMAEALAEAEAAGLQMRQSKCAVVLEALARDYDIVAIDPGPLDEVHLEDAQSTDEELMDVVKRMVAAHNERVSVHYDPETDAY